MSGLILFAILGIWSVALYYLGYRLSWFVSKKWARQLVGVTAVIGVTTVVLWDEIQGAKEFEILCVSARKFEIAPSDEGKKFEVRFSRSNKKNLQGYTRPIEEHIDTYTEMTTGRVIATGKGYVAKGGWLVRTLGKNPFNGSPNALLGNSFCYPSKYEDQVQRLRAMINIDV